MIGLSAKHVAALFATAIVMVLCGCSKKEEPVTPPAAAVTPPAAAPASESAEDSAAPAEADPLQGVARFDSGTFLAQLDKNGDRKVSREEYGAIWKDKSVAERNFKMIDRNGDGVLSGDEFSTMGQPK